MSPVSCDYPRLLTSCVALSGFAAPCVLCKLLSSRRLYLAATSRLRIAPPSPCVCCTLSAMQASSSRRLQCDCYHLVLARATFSVLDCTLCDMQVPSSCRLLCSCYRRALFASMACVRCHRVLLALSYLHEQILSAIIALFTRLLPLRHLLSPFPRCCGTTNDFSLYF